MITLLFVSVNSLTQRRAAVYGNHISLGGGLSDPRPQAFRHDGLSYMLLTETLWKHLAEIDEECNEMMDRIVKQMARREDVTEQLKSDDWLCWLQKMNSIRSRAEEVVLHDLVYSL